MIFNQYKHLLKIRHFIKFKCNEIFLPTRNFTSQENVKVVKKRSTKSRKVTEENMSKEESKKDKDIGVEVNFSKYPSQDNSLTQRHGRSWLVRKLAIIINAGDNDNAQHSDHISLRLHSSHANHCFGCTFLDGEALAVEGSTTRKVTQTGVTDVKDDFSQKDQSLPKKDEDICANDFLIRNILTFPLHVTPDKTEISNVEPQVKKFPSVTSILQETMPLDARKRLDIWKQKMVEMMGPEKFSSYQTDPVREVKVKRLKCTKRSKKIVVATLNRGTRFHRALKSYLEGEDIDKIRVTKDVEGCWNSVKSILAEISDVKAVESDVFHPHLQYKGIIDCVASYKNTPHVIEWKQSEKVKKDLSATFDAPIQLTAYMGALPWCKKADLSQPVTRGLVVVAYYDGAPAEVFQMDSDFCQSYWEQWLRRLQRYWGTRSPNLKRSASC